MAGDEDKRLTRLLLNRVTRLECRHNQARITVDLPNSYDPTLPQNTNLSLLVLLTAHAACQMTRAPCAFCFLPLLSMLKCLTEEARSHRKRGTVATVYGGRATSPFTFHGSVVL